MRRVMELAPLLLATAVLAGCQKPTPEETRPEKPVVSTVTLDVPNMT